MKLFIIIIVFIAIGIFSSFTANNTITIHNHSNNNINLELFQINSNSEWESINTYYITSDATLVFSIGLENYQSFAYDVDGYIVMFTDKELHLY